MELLIPDALKLVVFDLDDTLCIRSIFDAKIDKNVIDIIEFLRSKNILITLASLNCFAKLQLHFNRIYHKFTQVEQRKFSYEYTVGEDRPTYDWSKTHMLKSILKQNNVKPENVILFDDFIVHVVEARKLGMKAHLVDPNKRITWNDIKSGLQMFKTDTSRRHSCHF
jgi:HAD superfamily phosphatase (TIGR01681 family)